MFKFIEKIQDKYLDWQYDRNDKKNEERLEFIWGVKSYDDFTSATCNLYTMNDIDVIYDKKEKKYFIGIETIYDFKDGVEGQRRYLKRLLNLFTEFMISKGYNINKEVWLYDIFTSGHNINTKFDTIEDLYANFKFLVNGFIND